MVTPAMLKAAWVEARRWWPRKVVEMRDCAACKQPKGYRVLETCILVDEPQPGFREAIEAALNTPASAKRSPNAGDSPQS